MFLDTLQHFCLQQPHKVAIEFVDEHFARAKRVRYGELEEIVLRTMAMLRVRGVGPGDRVAIQLPKCLPFVYLHLAVMRLGAISLPLNTGYPARELAYFPGRRQRPALCRRRRCARCRQPGAVRPARADGGHLSGLHQQRRLRQTGRPAPAGGRSRHPHAGGPRRHLLDDLHQRHHRPAQGRGVDPRQPHGQSRQPSQRLGLAAGRCAASRAADLPCPRPGGGASRRAQRRRDDGDAQAFRPGAGAGDAGAAPVQASSWACPPSTAAWSMQPQPPR
jgi:hypothetical protein